MGSLYKDIRNASIAVQELNNGIDFTEQEHYFTLAFMMVDGSIISGQAVLEELEDVMPDTDIETTKDLKRVYVQSLKSSELEQTILLEDVVMRVKGSVKQQIDYFVLNLEFVLGFNICKRHKKSITFLK